MNTLHWLSCLIAHNIKQQFSDRKNFLILSFVMFAQNLLFFQMWTIMFSRISNINGWKMEQVAFLFGSLTFGFGIFFFLMGGSNLIARQIHSGALDSFLAQPRPVILSVLFQRIRPDSFGDFLTGLLILLFYVPLAFKPLLLSMILGVSSGLVMVALRITIESLAFWQLSEEAVDNTFISAIIAASNPQVGYGPIAKILILTIIPTGYVAFLPVEIMRSFSMPLFLWQLVASVVCITVAVVVFYRGLRNYSSGNNIIMMR